MSIFARMKNAYFKLHVAVFLFGFTAILGKLITLSEGVLVWYRMMFTAISMGLILWLGKKMKKLPLKDILHISFIGWIVSLHWVTFYGAIKYSNVSIALSCFASTALFTAVIEPLFSRQKMKLVEVFLGLCAILGIYLIFTFQKLYITGIVLALISALLASVFTIMNKTLTVKHDTGTIVFWQISSGFLFLTLCLPFYLGWFPSSALMPSGLDVVYLLVLSLLCTTLAFSLSISALRDLSPFTVNLSINLEPIYGIVLAFLIFNESEELNAGFYWGTGIIFSSVFLHALYGYYNGKKRASPHTLPDK